MGAERDRVDPEERIDLLLGHLGTRREGLSEREAVRRLEQYGPNEIRRQQTAGHFGAFVRQLTHPLAILLWAAALLAFVGGTAPLSVAILAVIFLSAMFAFWQELQAEKATEALKRYMPACAARDAPWRWRSRPWSPATSSCSRRATGSPQTHA